MLVDKNPHCLKGRVFFGPSFRRNSVIADERRNSISAPPRSTTWIENHWAYFGCFGRAPSNIKIRYTTTSVTFKNVVDKLDQSWATVNREYCQNGGRKKPSREKTGLGSVAHALKSPSYEGCTVQTYFQQSTMNSNAKLDLSFSKLNIYKK